MNGRHTDEQPATLPRRSHFLIRQRRRQQANEGSVSAAASRRPQCALPPRRRLPRSALASCSSWTLLHYGLVLLVCSLPRLRVPIGAKTGSGKAVKYPTDAALRRRNPARSRQPARLSTTLDRARWRSSHSRPRSPLADHADLTEWLLVTDFFHYPQQRLVQRFTLQ